MGKKNKTLRSISEATRGGSLETGVLEAAETPHHLFVVPAEYVSAPISMTFENGKSGDFVVRGVETLRLVLRHCGDDGIYNPLEGDTDVAGLKPGQKAKSIRFCPYVKERHPIDVIPFADWVKMGRPDPICSGRAIYTKPESFSESERVHRVRYTLE